MEQAVSCRINHEGPSESEGMQALRARVAAIERGAAYGEGSGMEAKGILPLGLAEIDRTLPAGGLACGAVHEASGSAVGGFAAWLAGRLVRHLGGAVLWCVKLGSTGQLYGPGLAAFGLDVRWSDHRPLPTPRRHAVGDGGESALLVVRGRDR